MFDQANKLQLPCGIFILINKMKRFPKHCRSWNFLIFFVDWSITYVKLFFETLTQPDMLIDNTVRLVCVHVVVERNF